MTEAEIMKALKCCIKLEGCKNCKYREIKLQNGLCISSMLKDLFALINCKNAEIERLEKSRAEWKEAALRKAKNIKV